MGSGEAVGSGVFLLGFLFGVANFNNSPFLFFLVFGGDFKDMIANLLYPYVYR